MSSLVTVLRETPVMRVIARITDGIEVAANSASSQSQTAAA
jgi:hypothetical protein